MTLSSERQAMIQLIQQANSDGARLAKAFAEAGICLRTYRRWYRDGVVQDDRRPTAVRSAPANKLSAAEQEQISSCATARRTASCHRARSCLTCWTREPISPRSLPSIACSEAQASCITAGARWHPGAVQHQQPIKPAVPAKSGAGISPTAPRLSVGSSTTCT